VATGQGLTYACCLVHLGRMISRRTAIVGLLGLAASLPAWEYASTQTATLVVLTGSPAPLTYAVTWGWGMAHRVCVSSGGCWPWHARSARWDVGEKPYHADVPVYVSADRATIFVGHGNGVWVVQPGRDAIVERCNAKQALLDYPSGQSIGSQESLNAPGYTYLGRFKVTGIKPWTRGDGVAFFSREQSPETARDLQGTCG
jgi:hypothetical protein